jgi:hypothetical protein
MTKLVTCLLSLLLIACSKEVRYSKEALLKKAQAADPSVTVILPSSMNDGVQCQEYLPPCISGHVVSVRGIEMLALEYENEAKAKEVAQKYKAYFVGNWIFDDVTGEPLLEKFVTENLGAKKP